MCTRPLLLCLDEPAAGLNARETDALNELLYSIRAEKGIALEPIRHYVDCFRYGCPPHGGLGIGINRLLMKLLDLPSIREASLFYRGPNRLTP